MLAGVLFPFVIKVATAVVATPIVAGGLVMGYLVGRRWNPRYGVFVAVAVGGLLVVTTGATQALAIRMAVTVPTWTTPTFSLDAILGIAVPLFIVTAAGQNAPASSSCTTAATKPTTAFCSEPAGWRRSSSHPLPVISSTWLP